MKMKIEAIRRKWRSSSLSHAWSQVVMLCVLSLFVKGGQANAQIPCRYDVEIIQAPPCQFTGPPVTVARGISPNGKYVVGRYDQCDPIQSEAFCYDTETNEFFTLPRPKGVSGAIAVDVNDSGWIVGRGGGGFLYKLHENEWIFLPRAVPSGFVRPNAINNAGRVCGQRGLGKTFSPHNAFIWSESEGMTDLGVMNGPSSEAMDINENGDVCGWTGNGPTSVGTRGFVYSNGTLDMIPAIPDGVSSVARGINNLLDVTGRGRIPAAHPPGFTVHGLIYTSDEVWGLGTLPGYLASFAQQINDSRVIVGYSRVLEDGSDSIRAHIWDKTSLIPLNTLLPNEVKLRELSVGWAINNSNSIACQATDDKGDVVGVLLTPAITVTGDVDHNCVTNVDDLGRVFIEWGKNLSAADLNNDGIVDVNDLRIVIQNWS